MRNSELHVLIVDDDQEAIRIMLSILARKGIRGTVAGTIKEAAEFLDSNRVDMVFLLVQPEKPAESLRLVSKVRQNGPNISIIMVSQAGADIKNLQELVHLTVKSVLAGCNGFLVKPLSSGNVEKAIDSALADRAVVSTEQGIIAGRSPKLLQCIDLVKRVAKTSMPVLVTGESGTGKELISSLIHQCSNRSCGPYLQVNCAALHDSLLESELFGHEKGAFTGAINMRKGRFEMAHGGTLLLDEITETPIKFQSTLLRVLEEQDFERVGGNESVSVDVRIVSTTNKNLADEASQGRFRHDLYYRLCGMRIIVPPLRERIEDLPDLVWHFVKVYSGQANRRITELSEDMMHIFAQYDWPGNIRQLRNVVRTSLALGSGPVLSLADVSWMFDELQPRLQRQFQAPERVSSVPCPNNMPLAELERQAILSTLKHTSGNQTKAAKILGISDRTLRGKIRQYNQKCLQSA